ncbi:MAG: CinA family nicotinamide mononucleotide deamidase-related protein [Deltaproteobacteria bacterium]|nr:CinA family nicotinamide mononucleotide deamidase-related protein [Deltaproteobacteria bacterium]
MKIGIISTGDELLRGMIADTNAAWMASMLDQRGYSVSRITTVGDDMDELSAVLEDAFNEYDLVIVGGGLGPTEDDITAQAAARAAGCPVARNEEAAALVRGAFERIHRPMVEINLKQADLPDGCTVLTNPCGTAPGFAVGTSRGRAVFLPGVPRELKPMFEQHVLEALSEQGRVRAVFKCFGRGESDIQAALTPIAASFPTVKWSYRSSFPEIGVTVSSSSEEDLRGVRQSILAELGKSVFAEDEIALPEALGRLLLSQGCTIGTAESCTGGLIGHSLTDVAGSSDYFRGGIIAYDNAVKIDQLGVGADLLEARGAVSEPVVKAMAEGVRKTLGVDLGVAVSGIAGPGGGTAEKPVGLVHLAVAHPNGVDHLKRIFHGYGRSRVKRISAWVAMWMAFRALRED